MSRVRAFLTTHQTSAVAISATVMFYIDRYLKSVALAGSAWQLGDGRFFHFNLFLNTGIAFSIPVPALFFWIAAGIAMSLLLGAFVYYLRTRPQFSSYILLIILGAVSNAYDRAAYAATVDYLIFFSVSAVNIADAMIIVGLASLFLLQRPQVLQEIKE